MYDGDGANVPDAMLEIWQADAQGRFSDPQDSRGLTNSSFKGFGRCGTGAEGYSFETIKPGAVPGLDGKPQAPHIVLAVFGRGMTMQSMTRIYFDDEPANASDEVMALVPEDRRNTLISKKTAPGVYRFNIYLQGDNETVFFDV